MRWEQLGAISLLTDENCTVQTDGLLLARFSAPKGAERACDLGTGCGVIPAIWLNDPGYYGVVTGVERNATALSLCRQTIEKNRLGSRFVLLEQDWNEMDNRTFDRVVCNPPYYAVNSGMTNLDRLRNEARHEDETHPLRSVIRAGSKLLQTGGRFALCHKPERLCEVLETLREHGLEPKRLQFVQHSADVPPFLFLCEARRNGKPGLSMLPTLITND